MFYLINHPEIKEQAYNYIFSLCNRVSFLYIDYSNTTNLEQTILGTEFEQILNNPINTNCKTDMWNMDGLIYTYNLTNEIKSLILKNSLSSRFELTKLCGLENLTLYKDNKIMYSVCSHEGYEHIDNEFENLVSDFCLNKIEKSNIYKEIFKKFENTQYSEDEIIKNLVILGDLKSYVDKDCDAMIYATPKFDCNFENYINLAKEFLSDEFYSSLSSSNSFKNLHPTGHPQKFEDFQTINFIPFEYSEIQNQLDNQINIWNVILLKKFGLINPYEKLPKQHTPSLMIKEEK